jgi:alpha-ribazole phosphatase
MSAGGGDRSMDVILLRHSVTDGNLNKRFNGVTDDPLCEQGLCLAKEAAARIPFQPDRLFVSPLRRCRETAEIVFPGIEPILSYGLRESSFGIFENKTHNDLKDDPVYQAWLAKEGIEAPPGGESFVDASRRVVDTVDAIIGQCAGVDRIAIVFHGGVMMMLMREKLGGNLMDWLAGNCGGFVVRIERGEWTLSARL